MILMVTMPKLWTLRNVRLFLVVFPSHLLPQSATVLINADTQTGNFSHWLAVHFRPKSSSAYNFNSFGILQVVPYIQAFIRLKPTVSDYNKRKLQGLTSNV